MTFTDYEKDILAETLLSPGMDVLYRKVFAPCVRRRAKAAMDANIAGDHARATAESGGFTALFDLLVEAYRAANLETPEWISERRY